MAVFLGNNDDPAISMKELTNLAVSPPQEGNVNFIALHSLLHGIVNYLGIADMSAGMALHTDKTSTPVPLTQTIPFVYKSKRSMSRAPAPDDPTKIGKAGKGPAATQSVVGSGKSSKTGAAPSPPASPSASVTGQKVEGGKKSPTPSSDLKAGPDAQEKGVKMVVSSPKTAGSPTDVSALGYSTSDLEADKTYSYLYLQGKVAKLEEQMNTLHELPSTQSLMSAKGPQVSDLYRYMQVEEMTKTNGKMLEKCATMIQDLFNITNDLLDDNRALSAAQIELTKDMNKIEEEMKTIVEKTEDSRAVQNKLRKLEEQLDVISVQSVESNKSGPSEKLQEMLEEVGKVVANHQEVNEKLEEMEDMLKMKADREEVVKVSTRLRDSIPGGEYLDLAQESLDKLHNEILDLRENVNKGSKKAGTEWKKAIKNVEKVLYKQLNDQEIRLKIDIEELRGIVFDTDPEKRERASSAKKASSILREVSDSKERLKELEQQVNNLYEHLSELHRTTSSKKFIDMDNKDDPVVRLQNSLKELRTELDAVNEKTSEIVTENSEKQKSLEQLENYMKDVEKKKADKDYVIEEIDLKADRKMLDAKVNRVLFDKTMDELNKMIEELLKRLSDHDDEWRTVLKEMGEDMEGKLDRIQFSNLRENLERQLRILTKKVNTMGSNIQDMDDEAAGLRKKLAIRFNCISCDKPIDVIPGPPVASIPFNNNLPGGRSTRPYTTYELDLIRNHAKSPCHGKSINNFDRAVLERELARQRPYMKGPHAIEAKNNKLLEMVDIYGTQRACGGSHTMTYPQRKMTRIINQSYFDELAAANPQPAPQPASQITNYQRASFRHDSIMGANGVMYQGTPESPSYARPSPYPNQNGDGPPSLAGSYHQSRGSVGSLRQQPSIQDTVITYAVEPNELPTLPPIEHNSQPEVVDEIQPSSIPTEENLPSPTGEGSTASHEDM